LVLIYCCGLFRVSVAIVVVRYGLGREAQFEDVRELARYLKQNIFEFSFLELEKRSSPFGFQLTWMLNFDVVGYNKRFDTIGDVIPLD
jgi:hypothetical protein